MLAMDRPLINPLTRVPGPYFFLAALLSILFHTFLLLIIQRNEFTTGYKTDEKQPIYVYFQTSRLESTKPTKYVEAQPSSKTSEHEVEKFIDKKPVQADPSNHSLNNSPSPSNTQAVKKDAQPEPRKFNLSDAKESLHLLSRKETFKCNQKEKEKLALNCNQDIYKFQSQRNNQYQMAIASAFKRPTISVSEKYKRDMTRVETLLNLQERLEEQINTYPENKMLIKQHRSITNEIQMIDKQYQEVNLLKVLDSGIKVIRKVINNEDK